jgi:pimeloyl-ACP methyl ester carboxylesterase
MGADTGEVDIQELRLQVSGSETADLAVESAGEGSPFVWSHALLGSMAQDLDGGVLAWRELTDLARVIRYDARGHGRSQSAGTAEDYSWRNQAQSLWEVIDQLTDDDVILGGASMGCGISLHAACQAPERVKGLVLVIPPRVWGWREGKAAGYRFTSKLLGFSRGLPLRLLGCIPFPPSDTSFRKNVRGVMAADLAKADYRGLAGAMRGAALSDFPEREALAKLKIPALILAWPEDDIHPVAVAEELHCVLSNSVLELAVEEEDPYTWPEKVRGFIKSLE